ncbi:F0F1 ATP synthase subunit delta [Salipiger mucosus]|uniref:ATP synthase subunit b n=1 Tax=Salipiger mucosus DSM 16094 TaxID=1123237 RepID=S9S446_9RHOB|nr:F0F1 ATP synthase subunit delta [Salipiger mucosus]EPX84960.1 ATP synthase B chain [Salipiger mucosus DSM 16094]
MQIDWWTLGLQTINFLVVVWLLRRFLYRPVRRMIAEREASDRKVSDEARASTAAAEAARADYERKRAELAETRRKQEADLHAEMARERDAVLKEAQEAADALMADTRETLERDRAETLRALRAEITALATDLAREALKVGAGPEAALRGACDHLDGLSQAEISELGADLDARGTAVVVETPDALDDAMQQAWRDALATRLGEGAAVDFETAPDTIGGARLRFPHAVLDLTVAKRLQDAAETTQEAAA